MEIFASILIIASVVLPLIAAVALVAWVGFYVYSWLTDCRSEECVVETEKQPEPASAPVHSPQRVAPAA